MEEHDGLIIESMDGVEVPTDETNLIYSTAKHLYELCGVTFRGLKIGQINQIPFARGLGSSSACIIGGLKGANRLMGNPVPDAELVNIAARIEGHPDNTAPALMGGLVTSVFAGSRVYYVKQEIKNDLKFVALIPDFELKTSEARAVLPDAIPRADGVFNLSRAALMSVSLYSGNYQNLRVAAEDRIHQPYRLKLIQGGAEAMEACHNWARAQTLEACSNRGAYAAFISGAGPTIMAIVSTEIPDFSENIAKSLVELGLDGWRVHTMEIDNVGTIIELA